MIRRPGRTCVQGSRRSKRNQGFQLDLYERGLTAALNNRVHTIPYDSSTVLRNNLRHTGVTGFTAYEYTLTGIDGQRVVLRGRSDGVAAVTDALLPRAIAGMNARETLELGRLWLTLNAVGSTRDTTK